MTTPAPLGYCYDCATGNCPHPSTCKPRPQIAVTLRNGTGLCLACARRTDNRNRAVRNGGHMAGAA